MLSLQSYVAGLVGALGLAILSGCVADGTEPAEVDAPPVVNTPQPASSPETQVSEVRVEPPPIERMGASAYHEPIRIRWYPTYPGSLDGFDDRARAMAVGHRAPSVVGGFVGHGGVYLVFYVTGESGRGALDRARDFSDMKCLVSPDHLDVQSADGTTIPLFRREIDHNKPYKMLQLRHYYSPIDTGRGYLAVQCFRTAEPIEPGAYSLRLHSMATSPHSICYESYGLPTDVWLPIQLDAAPREVIETE